MGDRPLIESLEKLSLEDVALREIIEGRITYVLGETIVLDDIVGLVTEKRDGSTSAQPFVVAPCNVAVVP
jgi:DNA-directed RNA polymerase subunit omega